MAHSNSGASNEYYTPGHCVPQENGAVKYQCGIIWSSITVPTTSERKNLR